MPQPTQKRPLIEHIVINAEGVPVKSERCYMAVTGIKLCGMDVVLTSEMPDQHAAEWAIRLLNDAVRDGMKHLQLYPAQAQRRKA